MRGLFLLFIFVYTQSFSQTIQGIVSEKDKAPIAFANIVNLRSGDHTHSDVQGKFELFSSLAGDTIQISHLAYKANMFIVQANEDLYQIILEPFSLELGEIVVTPSIYSLNNFADIDLKLDPVTSSQEVLQRVPGMIIGQHAGGGKAEQIFLRGFDIDHGTDIYISVDGMPVNMVSHAHGQGYADLHFLIPETIEDIDFGKGPYYADKGNFTTAGYVNFRTVDQLSHNQLYQELGQFNTKRTVGLFNLINNDHSNAYVVGEIYLTDGPFVSPQNFSRVNLIGKYSADFRNNKISIQGSHFKSSWDASGQIPQRAIEEGIITRFGAIDDTEGGITGRSNIQAIHTFTPNPNTTIENRVFLSSYDFELYSNFTFFLNDPENGDQIKQKEDRRIYRLETTINKNLYTDLSFYGGLGFRHDEIFDNELSRTKNRVQTLSYVALGDIKENNLFSFASLEFTPGKWLINPSLRVDNFNFYYENRLDTIYDPESENKSILSPKLNIIYSPIHNLQLYSKYGIGFHSNDTRVVVAQKAKDILPKAYGTDLGIIWKPGHRILLNTGLWYLFLEQEFVYVGDEGIVEPSEKTQRLGFDASVRWQVSDFIHLNTNINYAYARAIEESDGEDYIPLAPAITSTGGIYYIKPLGFSGALTYKYIADRPANEDKTIVAEGYFVTDANLSYTSKNWSAGIIISNIFDTDWNETQFATETRMSDEANSIEEIHFTPGTPLFIRGRIGFRF